MTSVTLNGFLKSINDYDKLVISLKLDEYEKCKKIFETEPDLKIPAKEYETNALLFVKLLPRDRNVSRNFEAIAAKTGKEVIAYVTFCKYDFVKEGENIKGWTAQLKTLRRKPSI